MGGIDGLPIDEAVKIMDSLSSKFQKKEVKPKLLDHVLPNNYQHSKNFLGICKEEGCYEDRSDDSNSCIEHSEGGKKVE